MDEIATKAVSLMVSTVTARLAAVGETLDQAVVPRVEEVSNDLIAIFVRRLAGDEMSVLESVAKARLDNLAATVSVATAAAIRDSLEAVARTTLSAVLQATL